MISFPLTIRPKMTSKLHGSMSSSTETFLIPTTKNIVTHGGCLHRQRHELVRKGRHCGVVVSAYDSDATPSAITARATATEEVVVDDEESTKCQDDGIGIVRFLERKNYLITGSTGFLAKVLIEKILRANPNVGKLYLLLRGKDEAAILKRVKSEIMECELFKRLEQVHGEGYRDFMASKLVPVVGNICEDELGIDMDLAARIAQEVHVIVNLAANTTLYERYDVALDINTRAAARVADFARKCPNLRLLMHVSTAYVNGERQGTVEEKPFYIGDSIAEEKANGSGAGQQCPLLPKLDVHTEIKLASDALKMLDGNEADGKMKELGNKRARMYGWQNAYLFTKAMGEMILSSYKGQIPIAIIRPSIIESTYADPYGGWIQGNKVLDPMLISYGKGQLPGFVGDPENLIDVVPVDMVVNTMIAAMAKHGQAFNPGITVYHASSSLVNPLTFGDLFRFSRDHFLASPLTEKLNAGGIAKMKFFSSMDAFSSFLKKKTEARLGVESPSNPKEASRLQMKVKRITHNLMHMAEMYEPYMFYKARFDNGNVRRLSGEMSSDESEEFPVDMRRVNWEYYLTKVHIPGFRLHVLKGK